MIDLRAYVFLDSLQPQYVRFFRDRGQGISTHCRDGLPVRGNLAWHRD